MSDQQPWVDITFNCLPLRSIPCFSAPVDASDDVTAIYAKLRAASQKHGLHNSYYLHGGKCIFHLTNHDQIGMIEFGFSGTILTDTEDMHTLGCDLDVQLAGESCEWLVASVVDWFAETVREAVKIEFDRFILAGDLDKTIQRLQQLQATSDAQGGFLGAWL
jgi:hypothetical protein